MSVLLPEVAEITSAPSRRILNTLRACRSISTSPIYTTQLIPNKAAAVAVAQKYVVENVKKEIKEAKDALNVVPKSIENFKSWVEESKQKLKKAQKEYRKKRALKEQRKRKLNS